MALDIASSLGVGSGINTGQLVADLTNATYAPKETAVGQRLTTANARISALASAKSSLTTFTNALTELLKGAEYRGQPVSNNATIATVGLIEGGVPKGLPAQLEVIALAKAQVLQSSSLTAATAVAGQGDLTLTVGGNAKTISLTAPNNTLNDLANAINKSGAGVTASVVTDQSGARLVLKGQTGAENAFTLTAGANADADLQRFTFDGVSGMTQSQTAGDAQIKIDNVAMSFASNEIKTAIPFVRINLNSAAPGTTVTLATDEPTSSMKDLVQEFVSAYNNLKGALNSATASSEGSAGLLASDSGVREMSRRLAALTSTALTDTGPYRTLSDLGVSTQRDGTLSLNVKTLDAALAANPEAVTQMLNPSVSGAANKGIAGALKDVTDYLNRSDGPLAASKASYEKLKESLNTQLEKIGDDRTNYSDRLTKTYAQMQARLLQFKATQSYLEQQVKAWNGSNN